MNIRPSLIGRARAFLSRAWALDRFIQTEVASGAALFGAATIAFAWANSPWTAEYAAIVHPMEFWVNEVLMAFFFLAVTLEIRREIAEGTLSHWRTAALPVVAAIGGIAVPALIYLAVGGAGDVLRGWAIPTATDIAFALGVLALLGRRVTSGLRAFLLALAIIDDLVAIVIITLAYVGLTDFAWLALAVSGAVAAWLGRTTGVRSPWYWFATGTIMWFGLYRAGVHPTLAGVALAIVMPTSDTRESILHGFAAFLVMPLFALVNAGVVVDWRAALSVDAASPALGVFLGFVIGKPLGVVGATFIAVRFGGLVLPPEVDWRGTTLVGCLAGIGFTMAIFVAQLAFGNGPHVEPAKFAILVASGVSAVLGLALGLTTPPRPAS